MLEDTPAIRGDLGFLELHNDFFMLTLEILEKPFPPLAHAEAIRANIVGLPGLGGTARSHDLVQELWS